MSEKKPSHAMRISLKIQIGGIPVELIKPFNDEKGNILNLEK